VPSLRELAANSDDLRYSVKARSSAFDVDRFIELESRARATQQAWDQAREQLKKSSKDRSLVSTDQGRAELKKLSDEATALGNDNRDAQRELEEFASYMPNLLDPRVPIGTEADNQPVKVVGAPPTFDFEPRRHDQIAEGLGILDIGRAVKISGSRFYALKNEGIQLRNALTTLLSQHLRQQGFDLISPPLVAKPRSFYTSGYLPFGREDNFRIEGSDLSLIGTSEQALVSMHEDEILETLPVLYAGDSMCFRTEAGSHGQDTAGVFRVHQFYKLEQIVICAPDQAEHWHQVCQDNEEWLMDLIGIHYQRVLLASGDLGAPAMIKYDCEGWFPSQKRFRELTSNSNIGDFQTRRGAIRARDENGKTIYPFTISATGFTDRLLWAILENFQEADGSVRLPDALRIFFDGQSHLRPVATRSA
jgi:seryl-tRNA synthetase